MAELFRLVKYYNLPMAHIYIFIYIHIIHIRCYIAIYMGLSMIILCIIIYPYIYIYIYISRIIIENIMDYLPSPIYVLDAIYFPCKPSSYWDTPHLWKPSNVPWDARRCCSHLLQCGHRYATGTMSMGFSRALLGTASSWVISYR